MVELRSAASPASRTTASSSPVGHQRRDPPHLGHQDLVGDQPLRLVLGHREADAGSGVLGGDLLDQRFPARVDEQAADLAQRVVPGRAVGGPRRRQRLGGPVRAQRGDLLDEQPRVVPQRGLREPGPQPLQVRAGGGQAVGVVDAQPADDVGVGGDPAQHLGVRGLEDLRVVHPHGGEVGDVEEPPVGELGVAASPVDEAVVLPLVHLLRGAVLGRAGRHRVAVLVVPQLGAVVGELERRDVVGGTEDRDQDRDGEVDVVPGGVRRLRALAQQRPPRRVRRWHRHAHVVGHEVEQAAQARLAQGRHERHPRRLAPDLVVGVRRVHHVVAVGRPGRRLQQR